MTDDAKDDDADSDLEDTLGEILGASFMATPSLASPRLSSFLKNNPRKWQRKQIFVEGEIRGQARV